jgi:uncharacterized protein (DUF1697 family)
MKLNHYVALLRGINVGGNNIIKMTDLKACFELLGFSDVATLIQSGNVLFQSPEKNRPKLTEKIEKALSKKFNYKSRVVVVSKDDIHTAIKKAPSGFGTKPDKYRYDVIFLKPPLTAAAALKTVKVKPGVDQAFAGKGVLYFSRLISKASKSQLVKIIQMPIYQDMTIRNWNTTNKLYVLMGGK